MTYISFINIKRNTKKKMIEINKEREENKIFKKYNKYSFKFVKNTY